MIIYLFIDDWYGYNSVVKLGESLLSPPTRVDVLDANFSRLEYAAESACCISVCDKLTIGYTVGRWQIRFLGRVF